MRAAFITALLALAVPVASGFAAIPLPQAAAAATLAGGAAAQPTLIPSTFPPYAATPSPSPAASLSPAPTPTVPPAPTATATSAPTPSATASATSAPTPPVAPPSASAPATATPSAAPASTSPGPAPASASAPASSSTFPTPAASAGDTVPPLYVHGQVLAIANGFFVFTSGDSLRVASGLVIPAGVTTGSYVRISIDQLARQIILIEYEPKTLINGEIDAANIPRQYVVVSPKSAPLPAATGQSEAASNASVTVTIVVHVPGNTPTSDDVYLSTDRSNYSPAEVRMDRMGGDTFSTTVSLASGTTLKYEFTRGSFATVERDRSGGIVQQRNILAAPDAKSNDTVVRWADLS